MFVKGARRLLYEERLRRLGLHSLHRRRFREDLKVVYKIFSGELYLDPSLFFSASTVWLKRSSFQSPVGPSSAPSKKIGFSNASRKILEQAPIPVVTAPSINSFKCQLDSALGEQCAEVP